MDKILVVLRSEFLRRVKSKWFIISTILGPVILIGIMVLPAMLGVFASESDERSIAVLDETGVLLGALQEEAGDALALVAAEGSEESVRAAVREGTYDGYLLLPAGVVRGEAGASYYSVEGAGLSLRSRLERLVERTVQEHRLNAQNAPPEIREILRADVPVRLVKLTEEGEAADASAASSLLGLVMGFFIYMAMFIYGAYVMHGVMEEKQNRVVEVMVSSVRPFQLLMGKVLGIGAMGLLQMGVWVVFLLVLTISAGSIAATFIDPADFNLPSDVSQEELLAAAEFSVPQISPDVFVWFLLFFLGGYLLYASLYAAVGSTVESQQDAQGLMTPIVMLIIIPIMFVSFLVETPNSTLSVILSMVPFFSPILMVVRIAVTEVPFWQVALSFLLLAGGFVGTIWVSSRIYRVGILMYGKKPSLKDLARWFRYA